MKILFVVSEVEDLVKTGGLADVAKALPIALSKLGHEVSIVMPYYRVLEEKYQAEDYCEKQVLFAELFQKVIFTAASTFTLNRTRVLSFLSKSIKTSTGLTLSC